MNRKAFVILVGCLALVSLLAAFVPQEASGVAPVMTEEVVQQEDYGMALDQRFHRIHTVEGEMECTQCHVDEAPFEIAQSSSEAPGPVDRRVCLGCHLNGPGPKFYEPKE